MLAAMLVEYENNPHDINLVCMTCTETSNVTLKTAWSHRRETDRYTVPFYALPSMLETYLPTYATSFGSLPRPTKHYSY